MLGPQTAYCSFSSIWTAYSIPLLRVTSRLIDANSAMPMAAVCKKGFMGVLDMALARFIQTSHIVEDCVVVEETIVAAALYGR